MRCVRACIASLASVALLAWTTGPARAGDTATGALWELSAAGFIRSGPAYPASSENQVDFVPLPFPVYRGKVLRIGEDDESPVRGRILRRDGLRLDVNFDINFGADSEDIDARAGMPDLDLLLQVGPELQLALADRPWLPAESFFVLQLRAALSWDGLDPTWQGLVLSPQLRFIRDLGRPRHQIKLRITPNFASRRYMDYYYEVKPQFATGARAAYRPDAGYLGTDITLSLRQPLSDRLEMIAGIRQGLHGGAANDDSPLFTDRSTTAFYAIFAWRFWESERRGGD